MGLGSFARSGAIASMIHKVETGKVFRHTRTTQSLFELAGLQKSSSVHHTRTPRIITSKCWELFKRLLNSSVVKPGCAR